MYGIMIIETLEHFAPFLRRKETVMTLSFREIEACWDFAIRKQNREIEQTERNLHRLDHLEDQILRETQYDGLKDIGERFLPAVKEKRASLIKHLETLKARHKRSEEAMYRKLCRMTNGSLVTP